jgi:hypothetical protein
MALSTRFSSRPTLGATRARQGRLGKHVMWVLLFGLALTILGFFAAYTWKSGDLASTEPNNAREQVDAQAFNAPEPAAINPQPAEKADPGTVAPTR